MGEATECELPLRTELDASACSSVTPQRGNEATALAARQSRRSPAAFRTALSSSIRRSERDHTDLASGFRGSNRGGSDLASGCDVGIEPASASKCPIRLRSEFLRTESGLRSERPRPRDTSDRANVRNQRSGEVIRRMTARQGSCGKDRSQVMMEFDGHGQLSDGDTTEASHRRSRQRDRCRCGRCGRVDQPFVFLACGRPQREGPLYGLYGVRASLLLGAGDRHMGGGDGVNTSVHICGRGHRTRCPPISRHLSKPVDGGVDGHRSHGLDLLRASARGGTGMNSIECRRTRRCSSRCRRREFRSNIEDRLGQRPRC